MKAKDLIEELKKLDPESVVYTVNPGCGCCSDDDEPVNGIDSHRVYDSRKLPEEMETIMRIW